MKKFIVDILDGNINTSGVYGLADEDGKFIYIGSSISLADARDRHKSNLKNNKYTNGNKSLLQDIYNNRDIYFKVLQVCFPNEREELEEKYIAIHRGTIINKNNRVTSRTSTSTLEEYMKRRAANLYDRNPNARINLKTAQEIYWYKVYTNLKPQKIAQIYNIPVAIVYKVMTQQWLNIEAREPETVYKLI